MVYSDHHTVRYLVDKKGFRLSEATYLVNAGFNVLNVVPVTDNSSWEGFQDRETLFWKAAGFDLNGALQWKSAKFSPMDALDWKVKGFKLQEAIILQRVDLTPSEVKTVTDLTPWPEFPEGETLVWKAAGFSSEEAKRLKGDRFCPKRALIWKNNGFTPEATVIWASAEFTLHEAKEWMSVFSKSGHTPEDLQAWKSKRFSPQEAKNWMGRSFTIDEAVCWRKADFSPEIAEKWREKEFSAEEGEILKNAGLSLRLKAPATQPWDGFSKEDELIYKTIPCPIEVAGRWRDSGFSGIEVVQWGHLGRQVAISWKQCGFTAEETIEWLKFEFSPETAKLWRDNDFSPKAACNWNKEGLPPDIAAVWHDNKFSPGEARALCNSGFLDDLHGLTIEYALALKETRQFQDWLKTWGRDIEKAKDWATGYFKDKPITAKRFFDQGLTYNEARAAYSKEFSSNEGSGQTGAIDSDLDTGPG